jgi:hypothetical protein
MVKPSIMRLEIHTAAQDVVNEAVFLVLGIEARGYHGLEKISEAVHKLIKMSNKKVKRPKRQRVGGKP